MSDEKEHTCHCSHVTVVVKDMGRIERLAWIIVTAVVGLLVVEAVKLEASHIRAEAAPAWPNERLTPDRVTH